jgi:uncharacterized BrkB/YihY/UPF0761 family membrane protein
MDGNKYRYDSDDGKNEPETAAGYAAFAALLFILFWLYVVLALVAGIGIE